MDRVVLQQGQLVLPNRTVTGDLVIEDGVIAEISPRAERRSGDRIIDATNQLVLPGLIDGHVHFRTRTRKGGEDFRSGSRAAAAGGVTSVVEMPDDHPDEAISAANVARKLALARQESAVNYGLWFRAQADNLSEAVHTEGVVGARLALDCSPAQAERMRDWFADYPGILAVHAEDRAHLASRYAMYENATVELHHRVRDVETALRGTRLALELAASHGTRLHLLHVSSSEEIEAIKAAANPRVSTAVTLPHLMLDATDTAKIGARAQCNPPVRSPHHKDALWEGLRSGTIGMVVSDHCPHALSDKRVPYPLSASGLPGVEWLLPMMLDAVWRGQCQLADVVRWTSARPAQVFHLSRKGRLEVGFDGDVVVVDPTIEREVRDGTTVSAAGWSPYVGKVLRGWPTHTLVHGRSALTEGVLQPGAHGRPLHPTRSSS